MPAPPASPLWHPSRHGDRRARLLARGRIMAALRAWFGRQGFIEVETPILQVSPGNEAHLHAFRTEWLTPARETQPFYLHTSPEFACKMLLAAGERRLFTFARVFRNRENTALHHPEFTMLEWYRAGEPYDMLIADCAALLEVAAAAAGTEAWRFADVSAPVGGVLTRLPMAEAFARHAGIDLAGTLGDLDGFAAAAAGIGVRVADDDSWSDIFSRVLSERIEPALKGLGAVILDRYPGSEAALARPCGDDPRFAERFELYLCGVELANAFGELTDPAEQRRRFEAEMAVKQRVYGESYPIDENFLSALALMPEASGIALGFDRLAMLATGARRIADVLWLPVAGTETA